MTVGLAATALQIFIGALLGCTAAYYGGVVDFVIMRVVDVILSLPTMPILIKMCIRDSCKGCEAFQK